MEDYNTLDQGFDQGITLATDAQKNLRQAGGWAMMFAVIGFVFTLIMLIATLAMMFSGVLAEFDDISPYSFIGGGVIVFFYAFMTAIYFLYSWLLMKFSLNAMKVGKRGSSSLQVSNAMSALKNMFMIMGISTIVIMALYLIMILVFAVGMAGAASGF